MNSKSNVFKTSINPILFVVIILLVSSCKKEQLKIESVKKYAQLDWKRTSDSLYDNPFQLTLSPGNIDILPGRDMVY